MTPPILLAVPNISEGRDSQTIAAIAGAFAAGDGDAAFEPGKRPVGEAATSAVRLLDVHSDRDHHRSVYTLAGPAGDLDEALLRGMRVAVERIDVVSRTEGGPSDAGQHPYVGAVDVVPVVYLDESSRGAACAQALLIADRIGHELEIPVFLYGELTATDPGSGTARAELRRGGIGGLSARIAGSSHSAFAHSPAAAGKEVIRPLSPDFGPPRMHPSAGATLVAARPPLVAFNLQLAPPADLADARRIAALIRDGGSEGLPGVRAIGVALDGGLAQVSMNIERPFEVPLATVVQAVRRHVQLASAELVGLSPRAALEGFPAELPIPGFDPARHLIENALGC